MIIPYFLFLILYGAALLICVFFFLFNLYHLKRFGFFDFSAKLHTMMVLGVCVIAVSFAMIFLRQVHWGENIDLLSDFSTDSIQQLQV